MATLTKDQVREIVSKRPAGTSPEGVVAALREQGHQMEGMALIPSHVRGTRTKQRSLAQNVVEHLPDIGGAVGGILTAPALAAGPLGIPARSAAAGLGGAAGEAARQLLSYAPGVGTKSPETSQEAAALIGKRGAEQAAIEAAGGLAGKGLKFVAKPLAQAALRATPEVAKVALREGIGASARGLRKVQSLLGRGGEAKQLLLNRATQAMGATYQTADLVKGAIMRTLARPEAQALGITERRELGAMARRVIADYPNLLTPSRLGELVRKFGRESKGVYRAVQRGESPASANLISQWNKSMRDAGAEIIDSLPHDKLGVKLPNGKLVKSVKDVNAYLSGLIDVKKALIPVAKKLSIGPRLAARAAYGGLGGGAGAALPGDRGQHAIEGVIAGALLSDPQVVRMLAGAMASPLTEQALTQGTRAVVAAGR